MLYHLLVELTDYVSVFNVSRYITFRALAALLTALGMSFLLSPWFIRKLKSKQIGQQVRNDGPESHFSKAGTPTMGGGLILFATLLPALLWMDWRNPLLWYVSTITFIYGLIGFLDDYLKVSKKNTKGLSGKLKLLGQFGAAGGACTLYYLQTGNGELHFPFFKALTFDLGWLYVPFGMFVIVGASNAVNLTDGLDGLAIGPVMTTASTFAILSYVAGHIKIAEYLQIPFLSGAGELAIFCTCLVGAGMGFLWYNTYPAQVFMGDVGSLPLGGALGAIAVFTKNEIILAIVGGVFVMEALSVITQVASFKMTGKRVFRMAPIHHHFELKGWPEPKVIVRFWIISIILAIVGLMSLKLR
ncbi:phospho-N-acetylmuramoyl-pentapeptide-transferase [Pseudobacteriovorax antillogorgiicola]|uniref:Phospho-N-acetylmuramoyl-pentapeptide-transferase n=1 Tax=Pseudobacteriovorax antillogorgiicola TaxID=1513793 RepID=A0A1Y6B8H7_9BACT|nr:phospho-N-acetylmuramoyl-pentapeptide-transferase [Pseudobacteriovorax antillogorgiicola]TCS59168.1 phospho-N-acetylmuramoyl-pentapeptide-transferase [Pseudobacteriovorax antillogorgiicola]SME91039.1 Phospho-N-acetylmuramoyl-pentapeptide-transferase [Pseudobacteriovorax antillogorgiicola]